MILSIIIIISSIDRTFFAVQIRNEMRIFYLVCPIEVDIMAGIWKTLFCTSSDIHKDNPRQGLKLNLPSSMALHFTSYSNREVSTVAFKSTEFSLLDTEQAMEL